MKGEIPWEGIGKSLEELLRYERRIGHYEHAGYDLVSTLVHGTGSTAWRAFVLDADHFAAVVGQVLAISPRDDVTPKEALDAIRTIVEVVRARHPEEATEFLFIAGVCVVLWIFGPALLARRTTSTPGNPARSGGQAAVVVAGRRTGPTHQNLSPIPITSSR